jgi:TRAP transporter TAXI family solute receptor
MKRYAGSLLTAATLVLAFCSTSSLAQSSAAKVDRLSIGTGAIGGIYHVLGGGMAKLLREKLGGIDVTAETTNASVDNMRLVGTKQADIGFGTSVAIVQGVKGDGPFKGVKYPVAGLANIYPQYLWAVTVEGTGIKTLADLKGKRVSTSNPGSGSELDAVNLLKAVGLGLNDIKRERLPPQQAADALKDRRIDALLHTAGQRQPAWEDIANTPGTTIKFLDTSAAVAGLQKEWGDTVYLNLLLPKGTYKGQDADVPMVGGGNSLFVREDLSDDLVYRITKILMENLDELAKVHPEVRNIKLEAAAKTPVPLHSGAARYYKEKGLVK